MDIYINEWKDKRDGRHFFDELLFPLRAGLGSSFLDAAIDNYECTDQRKYEYMRTLIVNPERGTCEIYDIESHIYSLRTPFEIAWDANCERADYNHKEEVCNV